MIKIYRYQTFCAEVASEQELKDWYMDNVPADTYDGQIPYQWDMDRVVELAERKHYWHTGNEEKELTLIQKEDEILENVNVVEVAERFLEAKKQGRRVIATCPECGSRLLVAQRKTNTFKCFACGLTGNPVGLIMAIKHLSHEGAIDFIDETYFKKF